MLGTGSGHDGQSRTKWNVHRTFKPDRRKFHHGNEGPENKEPFPASDWALCCSCLHHIGSGKRSLLCRSQTTGRWRQYRSHHVRIQRAEGRHHFGWRHKGLHQFWFKNCIWQHLQQENTYGLLEGEAYFEVAKDKEKPFIVKANGINVQALGTSFNIRAHKDDKSVAVSLISGKVKVDDGRHEAYMKPNERLVCNLTNGQFEKASFILMQVICYGEAMN